MFYVVHLPTNSLILRTHLQKHCLSASFSCVPSATVRSSDPCLSPGPLQSAPNYSLCLRSLAAQVHFPYQGLPVMQAELCRWAFIGTDRSRNVVLLLVPHKTCHDFSFSSENIVELHMLGTATLPSLIAPPRPIMCSSL